MGVVELEGERGFLSVRLGLIILLGPIATIRGGIATSLTENRIPISPLPGRYSRSPQILPVNQSNFFPSSLKVIAIVDSP